MCLLTKFFVNCESDTAIQLAYIYDVQKEKLLLYEYHVLQVHRCFQRSNIVSTTTL